MIQSTHTPHMGIKIIKNLNISAVARSNDIQKNMNEQKKKVLISYKKAQTLMSKMIQMLENDDYCIDIMHQNLATMGLLKAAHQTLMENHLDTCFNNAMKSDNAKLRKEMIEEIKKVSKYASKFSCNWSLNSCGK